jgi:hypothetical protein
MASDIQDLLRQDMARDRPRPAARSARKAPRPIVDGPSWVVACFAGSTPRFLCRDARGFWVVTMEPTRALRFDDEAAAGAAAQSYADTHHGHVHSAPGEWRPWRMTLKASFEP